jgi:AbrB family looped-hinge helix DNA binding protein
MSIATLSSKFQLSIPKDIREAMHLKPGQQLSFLRVGKSLRLVPVMRLEDLFGLAKGAEPFVRDRSTRREDILPTILKANAVNEVNEVEAANTTNAAKTAKKLVMQRRIRSGKAAKSKA